RSSPPLPPTRFAPTPPPMAYSSSSLSSTRTGSIFPGRGLTRQFGLQPERIERLRARRDEDALRLEVELERLEAELAAEAGLLVAAERDPREGRVRHVHAHGAGLDARREPQAARGIARPDRRHQPVLDVVRDPDRVLLVL